MKEKNIILLLQFVIGILLGTVLTALIQIVVFGVEIINFQWDALQSILEILSGGI